VVERESDLNLLLHFLFFSFIFCCSQVGGEERTLLKFHPRLAPIKAAVLPLVKNKPELMEKVPKKRKKCL